MPPVEVAGKHSVFPRVDWQEASPESQGVDSESLKAAVAYLDRNATPLGAQELVIISNGYLIWKGPNIDAFHNVWSCTKTFTSTVLGLLIADGKCTLDGLAVDYIPDPDGRFASYADVKLRHLASMSAGYRGEILGKSDEQPWGEPPYYLNPTERLYEAGTQVQYNDHEVFLLGSILTRLAGEPLASVFKRRIAGAIGMARWDWGASGEIDGVTLNNAAGTPTTPGIRTTARQMARFGLLYLNRGNWNGKRLLPASFVDETTTNQVPGAGRSTFLHGRYGFYWWTNDIRPDGRRPWPAAPPMTYTALGHNSNYCFVIPEWNMVIVRMGASPAENGGGRQSEERMWNTFFSKVADSLRGDSRQP
jgi:CubicO group peptidase (beta-lactamase class C family)